MGPKRPEEAGNGYRSHKCQGHMRYEERGRVMELRDRADGSPPWREALWSKTSPGGRAEEQAVKRGKPLETAGRKARGTKAFYFVVSVRRENAKSAWPLIIKGKPQETVGRKTRGLKRVIAGRKGWRGMSRPGQPGY